MNGEAEQQMSGGTDERVSGRPDQPRLAFHCSTVPPLHRVRWTAALLGCMLAVLANDAGGQTARNQSKTAKTPAPATKATTSSPSTLNGVYTNQQATRGRYVYLGSCRYCHTAETHTGKVFAEWWKGKQLSDLYSFVLERMPKNDPGSLAPEDVADVVAYLLKLNAMPVGRAELYPDADSLKKFRIDVKQKSSSSTAKGGRTSP